MLKEESNGPFSRGSPLMRQLVLMVSLETSGAHMNEQGPRG